MADKQTWLVYVALAGLSWGTYIPIIAYGGSELGKGPNARLMAILCVGLAYFLIGVMFPLALFLTGQYPWPVLKATGLVFAGLAGVAGAVGAICVVFATKEAPPGYRLYIAPLIFGLAPVINTLVSIIWLPGEGEPFHFGFVFPGWKLLVGIILVSIGAALVLLSKPEAKEPPKAPAHEPQKVALAPEAPPTYPEARP